MSVRQVKKRARRKNAIGDLRDRVTVHTTTSRPQKGGGVRKVFTPIAPPLFMKVETLGQTKHGFDGVNIEEVPTHRITARWRSDLTAEKFLEFKGSYFEILDLENLEERDEYLVMKCRVTGSVEREASAA